MGQRNFQVKIHHCLFQHLLWIEYLRVGIGLFSVTSVVESSAVRLVIVESSITNSTSVRRLSNVSEIGISLVSLNEIMISSFWFDFDLGKTYTNENCFILYLYFLLYCLTGKKSAAKTSVEIAKMLLPYFSQNQKSYLKSIII